MVSGPRTFDKNKGQTVVNAFNVVHWLALAASIATAWRIAPIALTGVQEWSAALTAPVFFKTEAVQ